MYFEVEIRTTRIGNNFSWDFAQTAGLKAQTKHNRKPRKKKIKKILIRGAGDAEFFDFVSPIVFAIIL